MPISNAEYKALTDALLASVQKVKTAAEQFGVKSTAFTLALLGELMASSNILSAFSKIPKSERDDFFAEVWDSAIGTEPNALVHQLGSLTAESTEEVSDAVKTVVLSYFNRVTSATPV